MHRLFSALFLSVVLCENCHLSTTCSLENLSACSENPDDSLRTPEIATRHGYPAQIHTVTTDDRYILTIHRIPGSKAGRKGSQPVFLQHCILCSSAIFVSQGNASLAFILADAGYDVWMGNSRGNVYSKAHVTLSTNSAQYWNFSWHEMGIYDLPAVLGYVSDVTNKPGEIIYIGHSMGSTMFFIFASTRPQLAKTVKMMAALAPVAYMNHVNSPICYMVPYVQNIEWLMNHLGMNEFLPNFKLPKLLFYYCERLPIDRTICENIVYALAGIKKAAFRSDLLSVFVAHIPAGSSTKALLHYVQEMANDGKFQQYDYGCEGNLIKYGTLMPPEYNLTNINVATFLMTSRGDVLASYIDAIRLSGELTNLIGLYMVPPPEFDHLAYFYGKDTVELVYKPLMRVMKNYFTE